MMCLIIKQPGVPSSFGYLRRLAKFWFEDCCGLTSGFPQQDFVLTLVQDKPVRMHVEEGKSKPAYLDVQGTCRLHHPFYYTFRTYVYSNVKAEHGCWWYWVKFKLFSPHIIEFSHRHLKYQCGFHIFKCSYEFFMVLYPLSSFINTMHFL